MIGSATHPGLKPQVPGLHVSYEGSDDILAGTLLCHDLDNATAAKRAYVVEKPSALNLAAVAGLVIGGFSPKTGPNTPTVIPPTGAIVRGVQALTHADVSAGDLLGVVPGAYTLGKCVVGPALFRATEAVDGSDDAALVTGDWGYNPGLAGIEESGKIVRFFDRFDGSKAVSTTADAATYLKSGTNAGAAFADQAGGGLTLHSTTTHPANITLNGESFTLASGKALWFRCRFKVNDIGADAEYFIGLGTTDTAFLASVAADYIGLRIAATDADFDYVKDGATGLVSVDAGTIAADTEYEFAFHVENGVVRIFFGLPGAMAQISHTTTATEIPDDELLTFICEGKGTATVEVTPLELEINNYVG